ncbi:MAG: preprotein translocase subunit SecA [Candidatus Eremiobacteraeota bacterium]|nr:preprotein translocase subunit SecA [Candidatus Eremiobacteraeota bacterium]MBC5827770.1 preprotein translocase subunit SecA [Candidatus Eremiobacteraeota bacterium]
MSFLNSIKSLVDGNDREVARLRRTVVRINALESGMQALSDAELAAKTPDFRERLARGATLDELLPEAFAACREIAKRTLNMRPFDVQLIGGMVLHEGKVAEMRTGEGKTLVATLPVYLNALAGKGVHLVTVNDYLAKRDAEWMAPIYNALGLSVGVIQHFLAPAERHAAYASDVTYVTNNEVGFDYLRDNMAPSIDYCVQRQLNYAIVDEVDSILVDEARTPLIISGRPEAVLGPRYEDASHLYEKFARTIMPQLVKDEDYTVDEKMHAVPITEKGVAKVERLLGTQNLYDPVNLELAHQLQAALKAKELFRLDEQYVVKDGEIVIVDEFTGRLMYGRRYSDGIHQAIEAKEGIKVKSEDQTLATITFQNYFRLYKKLAGMTGTAKTEEREFREIYRLDVIAVPTNVAVKRKDYDDMVYKNEEGKFRAVIGEILELHQKGQPVLVGTRSIEKSERLSAMLSKRGIDHQVLNAKYHEKEAQIIKDAGLAGRVTIATNMAGRGVDIKLGEGVTQAGGLHIIGTERHESRRIDNQLRGRSGRQGDPGSSRFYVGLDDELMRIFGGERILNIMERFKIDDDTPIEAGILTASIERAQKKVEAHNYEARKHVLEYDDVMNKQRTVVYSERRRVLEGHDLRPSISEIVRWKARQAVDGNCPENAHPQEWDRDQIIADTETSVRGIGQPVTADRLQPLSKDEMVELLATEADRMYSDKEDRMVARYSQLDEAGLREGLRMLERGTMLQIVDRLWIDHLYTMDSLKQGIGLRGWGQKDPRVEYEKEAFELFEDLKVAIQEEFLAAMFAGDDFHIVVQGPPPDTLAPPSDAPFETAGKALPLDPAAARRFDQLHSNREDGSGPEPARRTNGKVGRNDPCPCGSGRKFKKCHGATAA